MHSCAFWTMFFEVEIDENMLKAKTIDVAFWRYKKIFFSEFRTAENNLKSNTRYGAFRRYLKRCSRSWNCWEKLKARTRNGAFWRYYLGSWNCLENFERKKLNGAFGRFSKNVVDDIQGSYWMWKYVNHCNNP